MRRSVLAAAALATVMSGRGAAVGPSPGPRQSSPIAVSDDGSKLVNVNQDVGTVSVFAVAGLALTKEREIKVGKEPVSVAIHPDGVRAYVANAFDGTVAVLDLGTGKVTAKIVVGPEPRGVALSPNGTRLYVAVSAANRLAVIDTATNAVTATVDLAASGRSPRAVAVTNDGDGADDDELVFVAMFFGAVRLGKATAEGQDDQRDGVVAVVEARTNALHVSNPLLTFPPIANAGFNSNGRLAPASGQAPSVPSTNPQAFTTPTGAYPNQLAGLALRPGTTQGFVVATGASPNGPLRFNSNVQGLVMAFDAESLATKTASQTDPSVRRTLPLNLNQGVNLATTPAPRLFHSNPTAAVWRPDGSDGWIAVQNSDVVVRMTADSFGAPTIGAPLVAGPSLIVRVDLSSRPDRPTAADAPRGLAMAPSGNALFVSNYVSRSVVVLDVSNATAPTIAGAVQSSALPTKGPELLAQQGAALFFSGRGPNDRMASESWGSCASCHPDGRSDGVTWMFDAGPRQTLPLDGTFSKKGRGDQRVLNWSGTRDEVHDFELNTRNVSGGRGLIDDDRLLLAIGGASGSTPTDSTKVEQFHQFTGAVSTTNDLAAGAEIPTDAALLLDRRDFATAVLEDGRVLVLGGRRGAAPGTLVPSGQAVLEFDPRKNKWRTRSSKGFTLRHSLGAAAVRTAKGDRVYAVGGYSTDGSDAALPVAIVEEYDPKANRWRTVAPLATPVAEFAVAVAGGVGSAEPRQLVHVIGGNTSSIASPSVTNATPVQRFDADPKGLGAWTAFDPAGLTPRRNAGAACVLRGSQSRVFVVGGRDAGGTVVATVEEYQAQTVTTVTSTHTVIPAARARFGIAATLTTNQIYVVGGVDGAGTDQATVFEYSVANNTSAGPAGTPTGSWVTRANVSPARSGLSAVLPLGVTSLLPRRSAGRDARQDAIAAWVARKVRPARAELPAKDPAVARGRVVFGTKGLVIDGFSCATCHGGPKWTRSRVDFAPPPSPDSPPGATRVVGAEIRHTKAQGDSVLVDVGTFSLSGRTNEIRSNPADVSQAIAPLGAAGFNVPSLLSVGESAPYFYAGQAQTLEEAFDGTKDASGTGVRHHFVVDPVRRADLVKFLKSIDGTTPTFR